MTTVSYALGGPRDAARRGGDCRARDLALGLDFSGPHSFADAGHCQVSNGMLRLTVGAEGSAPSLAVEAWRGRVVVGDALTDELVDDLGGTIGTPEWLDMGTVVVEAVGTAAPLVGVSLVRVSPEMVTVRLVAPAMGDAFVTLERGERVARIQHGRATDTPVSVQRRVRWTDGSPPGGEEKLGRVQESLPASDGFGRFLASTSTVATNASAFSLTTGGAVASASFGAGVGTYAVGDTFGSQHAQLGDSSLAELAVTVVTA